MAIRNFFGNLVDTVGTALNLPELSISERLAGGNTNRTGRVPVNPIINVGRPVTRVPAPEQGQVLGNQTAVVAGPDASLASQNATLNSVVGTPLSGGGGVAIEAEFVPSPLTGRLIDVNSPQGRQQYFDEQNILFSQQQEFQIQDLQRQYNLNRQEAEQVYQDALFNLNMTADQIASQEQSGLRAYEQQQQQVGDRLSGNEIQRGAAFAQASPNAFQSAQIDSGMFDRNLAARSLGDISLARNQFSQDVGRSREAIARERQRAEQGYNQFAEQAQMGLQSGIADIQNQFNTVRGQIGANLTNADRGQGIGGFRFQQQDIAPVNAQNVDISSFGAYNPFATVAGSSQAQVKPIQNFFAQGSVPKQDLTQYLGGQVNPKEEDFFSQYLTGKAK